MRSFREIETISKRASRGAGFSWGVSEEIGKSVRLLEMFGLPGILHLKNYLDKINNKTDNSTDNLTETFSQSEIYPSDISFLFKKPWNKLPVVHQIIKIKEFCKKICNSKAKQLNMEKNLIDKLKKKILKNQIKYDEKNGKIIAINNLNKLNMNL